VDRLMYDSKLEVVFKMTCEFLILVQGGISSSMLMLWRIFRWILRNIHDIC